LFAWIKEQLRQMRGPLPWQLQMINELWLAAAVLILFAGYSSYQSLRLLGEWKEFIDDPATLLQIPGFARYLEWYMLIALAALTATAKFHFLRFLLPTPETLFLLASPVPRWKLYGARLTYALLLNLVLFSAISLPPLVVIGVWSGNGILLYFVLLATVAIFTSLTATIVGALLAALMVFLVQFIPPLWRILIRHRYDRMFPLIAVAYLAATSMLPQLPPFLLPRRFSPLSSWAAEPLVIAASSDPFAYLSSGIFHLLLLMGTTAALFGLFLTVYSRICRGVSFQAASLGKVSLVSGPLRFRRWPLFRKDLSLCLRCFLEPVALAGIMTYVFFFFLDHRASPAGVLLLTLAMFGITGIGFIGTDTLSSERMAFFLLRLSPLSTFSLAKSKVLVLFSYATAFSLIIMIVHIGLLCWKGSSWWELIIFFPMILSCTAFPLVAVGFWADSLVFSPKGRHQSMLPTLDWVCRMVPAIVAPPLLLSLFRHVYYLRDRPLLLVGVTISLSAVCAIGVYFLLRLVARRLERIEWL
jgi:hypothetical protein